MATAGASRRGPWAALSRWAAVLCLTAGLARCMDDAVLLDQPPRVPAPTALDKYISRKVVEIISQTHYAKHPVDQDYAMQWYAEYFRQLDPGRMFFVQADLDDFRSHEKVLGDLVLRQGSIDIAFEIYERYLQRVQEWARYSLARLAEPIDLNGAETVPMDRREAAWLADRAAQEDLWRRQLVNRLLVEVLADESEQDAPVSSVQPGVPVEADPHAVLPPVGAAPAAAAAAVAAVPLARRPPLERVGESYRRFVKRKLEVESTEIVEIFLNSLTHLYDPHSAYMAPDAEDDFDITMRLSLQGIGAVLTTKDSYVEIVEVMPGGPAARDGRLKAGDRILAVAQGDDPQNPVDVVDMPLRKVVRMIRGPKGTRVLLTVQVAGGSAPTLVDIVRDKVELKEQAAKLEVRQAVPVEAGGVGARVAVISLPSFYLDFEGRRDGAEDYASCTRDVQRLLAEAAQEPLGGVILDLRGNGGGALDEAVRLAGFFVDKGPVVQVRDYRGTVKRRDDTEAGSLYDGPLVVLVDKLSASASEIVAAALQDHRRAVIVGESSTHGKGTVQTVYGLDRQLERTMLFRGQRGGSVKFTIQKFYRVNGGSTQVRGVVPDVRFASFTDHMELGEASMPHALPWDEIEALPVVAATDVTPWLGELQQRSAARQAASAEFAAMAADIARFAERRKQKELPLNLEARRALQKEEEQWARRLREQSRQRQSSAAKALAEEAPLPDLVLDEAVQIMADLIALHRGALTAAPPVAAQAAPAGVVAE